jgi:predicted transposase YbfD/YdcC
MTTPLTPELAAPAPGSCPALGSVPPLVAYLAQVPDPRAARGKRHPLGAILSLLCCALLSGTRTLQGVADWGRDHAPELIRALGFTRSKTPCCATLHTLLGKGDGTALEAPLRAWVHAVEQQLGRRSQPEPPAPEEVAIDGKCLRGALKRGAAVVGLVSALGHQLGLTLGATEISDGDEIGAVQHLLTELVLTGKVVTLDALHTQRETAQRILAGGGDYLMVVKGNQPQLKEAIRILLGGEEAEGEPRLPVQEIDDRHGRLQSRWLRAVSIAEGALDWPGAKQVFVVERASCRGRQGQVRREEVVGVTSQHRDVAGPAQLARQVRGHWSIENRSHWIRDVVFGEDACLCAAGKLPQTLALLRTWAISRLRLDGVQNIARETRRLTAQPWDCLRLLGLLPDN